MLFERTGDSGLRARLSTMGGPVDENLDLPTRAQSGKPDSDPSLLEELYSF